MRHREGRRGMGVCDWGESSSNYKQKHHCWWQNLWTPLYLTHFQIYFHQPHLKIINTISSREILKEAIWYCEELVLEQCSRQSITFLQDGPHKPLCWWALQERAVSWQLPVLVVLFQTLLLLLCHHLEGTPSWMQLALNKPSGEHKLGEWGKIKC